MNLSQDSKQGAAIMSMAVSLLLTLGKFVVALMTGSLAVLSEALHSLIDFGATVITWFAIRWADQPADDDHHFGHAKIESVAALFECFLLLATAIYVAYEAALRLWQDHDAPKIEWWAIGLIFIVIAVDWDRSMRLRNAAQTHGSDALAADAAHFQSDMLGSFVVLAGLTGVLLGVRWADSAAAFLVAALIIWIAHRLAIRSLETLLDQAPIGVSGQVRQIVESDPGVLRVGQLRLRKVGPTTFINMVAEVPRSASLSEIGALKERVATEIRSVLPNADISLVTNPVALDSETAFDKVELIASARGLAVHHLVVQHLDNRLAISFDLEVDGSTTLQVAHEQATELEEAIRQSLGTDVEVESHIEPKPDRMLKGVVANSRKADAIERVLKRLAMDHPAMHDVHNIRVRDTDGGVYVHYHCRFASDMGIAAVHSCLDTVESQLQSRVKGIARVVAHAEPLGRARHAL